MARHRRQSSSSRRPASPTAWLLALVLAVTVGALAPTPAIAATERGYDISWPQCPNGQPMPPTNTSFVIIGLTRGLAFTENPCLADQVGWAKTNAIPAQAYAMATFPTDAQLSEHGERGPWAASSRADQLRNVGYAEGAVAVAQLAKIGWKPGVVWIDVEPRPAQPWPGSTAAQKMENRYVIAGLMRALHDNGYGYGIYSYLNGWLEVTDSWQLPGVPVWATAGKLDYPAEAEDRCTTASFSGGPVHLAQWTDGTYDFNLTCDGQPFADFTNSRFVDIPPGTLFLDEIEWLAGKEVTTGWVEPEGTLTYRASEPIARDAMAAFLYRLAGSPDFQAPSTSPFTDVAPSVQFYKEMTWLKAQGISTGYPDGTFRPADPVSREAMAAFMYRFRDKPAFAAPSSSPFSDVVTTDEFFKEIAWLSATGISTGWPDGTYRPVEPVMRDAMAAFMFRLSKLS